MRFRFVRALGLSMRAEPIRQVLSVPRRRHPAKPGVRRQLCTTYLRWEEFIILERCLVRPWSAPFDLVYLPLLFHTMAYLTQEDDRDAVSRKWWADWDRAGVFELAEIAEILNVEPGSPSRWNTTGERRAHRYPLASRCLLRSFGRIDRFFDEAIALADCCWPSKGQGCTGVPPAHGQKMHPRYGSSMSNCRASVRKPT